jgi:hypothetical protein
MSIFSAVFAYLFFTLLSTIIIYYGLKWQRPRSFWTNYFVAIVGALGSPFLLHLFPHWIQMNFYSMILTFSSLIFFTSFTILMVLHKFYSQQEEI